jgi:hypothetical protein
MNKDLISEIYSNNYLYKYWITGEISNGVKVIKKNIKNIKEN